jgi:hypothetical protein
LKNTKLEPPLALSNCNLPSLCVPVPEETEWFFVVVGFGKQRRLLLAESEEEESCLVVPTFHPGQVHVSLR